MLSWGESTSVLFAIAKCHRSRLFLFSRKGRCPWERLRRTSVGPTYWLFLVSRSPCARSAGWRWAGAYSKSNISQRRILRKLGRWKELASRGDWSVFRCLVVRQDIVFFPFPFLSLLSGSLGALLAQGSHAAIRSAGQMLHCSKGSALRASRWVSLEARLRLSWRIRRHSLLPSVFRGGLS